jgi:AraC-like DNA-binding protein
MYLWNTDAQSATPRGRSVGGENWDAARKSAAGDSQHSCRIGVVISDDCSSGDVAKVLARTCEHFDTERGREKKIGKFSITIIAARSGFVFRENASLPVWCEAICDVDPLRFHYFVVPKSGKGTVEPRREIVEWLARVGASGKIIVLPLDADTPTSEPGALADPQAPDAYVADASEENRSERAQEEASAKGQSETGRPSDISQASGAFEKPTPSERIKETVAWLNKNYGSRVSISNMAEHALMSERNFLRRFRAEMGHTPHEYLSQIRLESARQLLVSTALPVDKIARHCGLFNGDHLRKHFLKRFGMSPAEYRTARFNELHVLGGAGANRNSDR